MNENNTLNLNFSMESKELFICKNLAYFDHIVNFVEAFYQGDKNDLWLVMEDAGISLQALMYTSQNEQSMDQNIKDNNKAQSQASSYETPLDLIMITQSSFYRQLKSNSLLFQESARDVLAQVLSGVAIIHELNITHRDLKPSNVMLKLVKPLTKCLEKCNTISNYKENNQSKQCCIKECSSKQDSIDQFEVRIIDFGSAVDPSSLSQMYGTQGPTLDEQTLHYAPPEIIFGFQTYWKGSQSIKQSWQQDIWSVGVMWLEFIIGQPQVFDISDKKRSILHHQAKMYYKSSDPQKIKNLEFIKGLSELCIYPPVGKAPKQNLIHQECSEQHLLKVIQEKDQYNVGLGNNTIQLRLLLVMLQWNSNQRPQAKNLLNHAYFKVPLHEQTLQGFSCKEQYEEGWC